MLLNKDPSPISLANATRITTLALDKGSHSITKGIDEVCRMLYAKSGSLIPLAQTKAVLNLKAELDPRDFKHVFLNEAVGDIN
jgi:hypothetical protein